MEELMLSNLVHRFVESETIKMSKLAKELSSNGIDVVDLGHGEPDFDTPGYIKEAVKLAVDQNWSHYAPVAGYAELREAVCFKFKRDNRLEYKPENIVVSTGAKQSLANALLALVGENDEVVIPAPYWVTYSELTKIAGGTPVIVNTKPENQYKLTAAEFENVLTERTKVFLFSSPCNPTGSVYSSEELFSLVQVLMKYPGVVVISDEIYEYINFVGGHQSIAQFGEIFHRVVVINGLSKGFAMTGYRLGFMAAPAIIARACEKIQGQVTNGTNAVTQRAAIVALTNDLTCCQKMNEEFLMRRDLSMELMESIPGWTCVKPDGAFYVLPDVSYYFGKTYGDQVINNADDLCLFLLDHAHVSTVSGKAFGEDRCIRLTFANSAPNIKKAYHRITEALKSLT